MPGIEFHRDVYVCDACLGLQKTPVLCVSAGGKKGKEIEMLC